MDLILISLEALDLYASDQLNKLIPNYIQKSNKNISLIRTGNYIRHPSHFAICNFKDTIQLIYSIYKLINKAFIQQTILHILEDYSYQKYRDFHSQINLSNLTKQYLHRFQYIYNKTQNLYNADHHNSTANINKIAITNLYIFKQIQSKCGIYLLIKYLYLNC